MRGSRVGGSGAFDSWHDIHADVWSPSQEPKAHPGSPSQEIRSASGAAFVFDSHPKIPKPRTLNRNLPQKGQDAEGDGSDGRYLACYGDALLEDSEQHGGQESRGAQGG